MPKETHITIIDAKLSILGQLVDLYKKMHNPADCVKFTAEAGSDKLVATVCNRHALMIAEVTFPLSQPIARSEAITFYAQASGLYDIWNSLDGSSQCTFVIWEPLNVRVVSNECDVIHYLMPPIHPERLACESHIPPAKIKSDYALKYHIYGLADMPDFTSATWRDGNHYKVYFGYHDGKASVSSTEGRVAAFCDSMVENRTESTLSIHAGVFKSITKLNTFPDDGYLTLYPTENALCYYADICGASVYLKLTREEKYEMITHMRGLANYTEPFRVIDMNAVRRRYTALALDKIGDDTSKLLFNQAGNGDLCLVITTNDNRSLCSLTLPESAILLADYTVWENSAVFNKSLFEKFLYFDKMIINQPPTLDTRKVTPTIFEWGSSVLSVEGTRMITGLLMPMVTQGNA